MTRNTDRQAQLSLLVSLLGKVGHELLTGAWSNEVKMSHLAPCLSGQTTTLVWTTERRARQQVYSVNKTTCNLHRCHEHQSVYPRERLNRSACYYLNALYTSVSALSTPCFSHAFHTWEEDKYVGHMLSHLTFFFDHKIIAYVAENVKQFSSFTSSPVRY